jgi:hypothetical protein
LFSITVFRRVESRLVGRPSRPSFGELSV